MIKASEVTAYTAFHPGELLKDEFDYRGISQNAFSEKFGISYSQLNAILNGKRQVTPEFALTMEAALGVNADMLVRMQSDYNIYKSRHNKNITAKLENIRKVAAAVLL